MAASGGGVVEGRGGQPMLQLTHGSGAVLTLYLWGATITSFVTADGQERLFLSAESHFDGKGPIRGGIPVVFPQFGPGALPQHGFARTSLWTVEKADGAAGDALLSLADSEATRALWPHAFRLEYHVNFDANSFETELRIRNTGDAPFDFQTLLHTYHLVRGVDSLRLRGFRGAEFVDKMRELGRFVHAAEDEREDGFAIERETDQIYTAFWDEARRAEGVTVSPVGEKGSDRLACTVSAHAAIDGVDLPADCVLWNPWIEKSKRMPDFGDEEFHHMVCVEPGLVSKFFSLPAGSHAHLRQSIRYH